MLCLLKFGESHQQSLIHVVFPEVLHASLVDAATALGVIVLLFKLGVFDPVLDFRVDDDK